MSAHHLQHKGPLVAKKQEKKTRTLELTIQMDGTICSEQLNKARLYFDFI